MRLQQYLTEKKTKSKPMTFVRIGGLSKKNYNKIYGDDRFHAFHRPPVKKGIFAFIWPYIEDFLWVWAIPTKEGDTEGEWKKRSNKIRRENMRKFEYSGELWCHFKEYAHGVTKGAWVKVHTDELREILKKVKHEDMKSLMKTFRSETGYAKSIKDPYKRGLGGYMSRDHLEVFIEKVN